MISPQKRREIIDALRRGTVPGSSLDLEQRLASVTSLAPMFSAALRGYRRAQAAGDMAIAEGIIAWLAGQPNVAAPAKRYAGVKGDLDHFGALNFLHGILAILRDAGQAGPSVATSKTCIARSVRC